MNDDKKTANEPKPQTHPHPDAIARMKMLHEMTKQSDLRSQAAKQSAHKPAG
jgi:hypothetical protein